MYDWYEQEVIKSVTSNSERSYWCIYNAESVVINMYLTVMMH